jgi:hypothetical protein
MDAAGLPCELGLVRPAAWGPVEEGRGSLADFLTLVVRAGGDTGRFYAPWCAGCPAGRLSPELAGAQVFSPKPELMEEAQAYNEKVRTKAFAESGSLDIGRLQRQAEEHARKEGWYRIETAGEEG